MTTEQQIDRALAYFTDEDHSCSYELLNGTGGVLISAPHAEKPFHYKAFRADGRPVITTTMPNVQFLFEQTANLVPAHSEIKYAENEEWKPLPHQNNRVRIISTLGQRSQ